MSKIEIAEYIVENKKIPKEFDNYTIVQISDLHNKSFGNNNIHLIFNSIIFVKLISYIYNIIISFF